MTLEALYTLLTATKLPVTYLAWPEGQAPSLPWIAIAQTGSDNFAADNIVYQGIDDIDVELYTKDKSPATEQLVESALTGAGIFWNKAETYLDTERCYMITYEIEV